MHPAIAEKRETLAALCRRYGVVRLEVFGSAARGTDFDPASSDADFLVEFDKAGGLSPLDQFFGLAEALETLLGRPVDLVEPSAIRNPYLRAAINRSRELIHGYATVDHPQVWRIVRESLPGRRETVAALLAEMGPPDP
ncbi:nucleotidyltransferase domain-containing protein [Acidiphilium sp.]|uniref:nucleotidyltransferase domain-containing protein n=1 Tax=Acidiphilium sp. TaxID=527 RepID=UPI00258E2995|nr:nucleotidyltransferase domain-containing protein [Acidiphilium sp.]